MLDSGGFQILQAENKNMNITYCSSKPLGKKNGVFNIAPEHVVEAAVKLNPDIMVALDNPIKKIPNASINDLESEFKNKLLMNVLWAKRTAELRQSKCPNIKLFIPIQCYTIEQFDRFYKMLGSINYDGFSMPVRNLSMNEIAAFYIRLYQLGVKMVHLLGTTSFRNIALSAYFAKHYFDWISLDATTWNYSARYCFYMNPFNLKQIKLLNLKQNDNKIHQQCNCQGVNKLKI